MTGPGSVRLERLAPHLAAVVVDRPAKLNAMTVRMYADFADCFEGLSRDAAVRCVLLRGAGGRAFCVGSDIAEFAAAGRDPNAHREAAAIGRRAVDALAGCPVPVVAQIEGACIGGGLQIAAACDIRVAHPNARFAIPIKALGVQAEISDLAALRRTLGHGLTLDLLLTGRTLSSAEAALAGFVTRVDEAAAACALAAAQDVVDGALRAARWHKRALAALADGPRGPAFGAAAHECFDTEDFVEGCAAFLGKRAPRFAGR